MANQSKKIRVIKGKEENVVKDEYKIPTSLNVTVYDEDAYYRTFPRKTEDDYEEYLEMHWNPFGFIQDIEKTNPQLKIENLRRVLIDDIFFDYLKEEKLENSEENRMAFINSVDDETCLNLWKGSGFDFEVLNLVIPVSLFTSNIFHPSDPIVDMRGINIKELKGKIAKELKIKPSQIFVVNSLYRLDLLQYNEEVFEESFLEYYLTGKVPQKPTFDSPTEKGNLVFRGLPLAIKIDEPCFLTRKDARDYKKNANDFVNSLDNLPESIFNGLENELKNKLNNNYEKCLVPPVLISFMSLFDYYEDIANYLSSECSLIKLKN